MATQQTTVLELPHDLTNEEKLELQNKIMKFLDTKQDLESELESAQAEFKRRKADIEKRTKDVDTDIYKVRSEIKVGREMRKYNCNIMRDVDSRTVKYVAISGPLAGEVIKQHEFTQDDWAAVLKDNGEPELPFDGVLGDDDDEPQDLREQADLTAEGPVQPNMENGKVIGGPDTDAYNMLHADSPYQHLSEGVDFKPAVPGAENDGSEPTDAADVDRDDENDLGTPHTEGDEDSDEDSDEDEEEGDDDEPQAPTPNPPKRKARRTGGPKE